MKTGVRIQRLHLPRQTCREIDPNGTPRTLPNSQITPLVADIVETVLAKAADEDGGFDVTNQVGAAVRSEATGGPHLPGKGRNDHFIRPGSQPHLAPRPSSSVDFLQHGRVQDQSRRAQGAGLLCEPALQRGAPASQPEWQGEQFGRRIGEQPQQAFGQQVAPDQRAVDVNDKRNSIGLLELLRTYGRHLALCPRWQAVAAAPSGPLGRKIGEHARIAASSIEIPRGLFKLNAKPAQHRMSPRQINPNRMPVENSHH